MAIFKPSNLTPSLEEIDVNKQNTFSAQANTSGESVKAYKFAILNNNSDEIVYQSPIRNLPSNGYIKNKGFLDIPNVSSSLSGNFRNGKDYQWTVRMYDAVANSTAQPITKVCDGFLVGSTTYVLWTNNNEQLAYDRYVQINAGTSNMFPIIGPNPDNLVLAQDTKRRKIDWVEKDLGESKNISKVELTDPFTFNYINGTTANIYLCNNEHTLTSVFADPNDLIVNSVYICLFNNQSTADNSYTLYKPGAASKPTGSGTTGDARQVIGYSSVTGEIRVQEPFKAVPTDGLYYVLYEYDRYNKKYTALPEQIVSNQIVGGKSQGTFSIIQNYWQGSTHQLFIQPNINIKTDDTNPPELIFENGVRIDIKKKTAVINGKTVDVTFDKLDNTQWLINYQLTAISQSGGSVSDSMVSIIPGSKYSVYTDFMDNMPNSVFYARTTPVLTLQYKNLNTKEPLENINPAAIKNWRDMQFHTVWSSPDRTQVKYYQYILYDASGYEIDRSDYIYDSELLWYFRGFETSLNETTPVKYAIQVNIVDELDREFETYSEFLVLYKTEKGVKPLQVTYECEEQAIRILASAPTYAESTNRDGKATVTEDDLAPDGDDYLVIPKNKVLNYTNISSATREPILISENFTYVTQFKIRADFIYQIPTGGYSTVLEIAHKNKQGTFDKYALTLSDFRSFALDPITGKVTPNYNKHKFRWYKNDDILNALPIFNGNSTEFDIAVNDPNAEFINPGTINFALQKTTDYTLVETLPVRGTFNMKYVLTKDYMLDGQLYSKGIYTFVGGRWKVFTDSEFFWVDNLDQTYYYTYDMLKAPENTRNADGKQLNWAEEGNIWVDDFHLAMDTNIKIVEKNWFKLYFKIIDDDSGTPVVSCDFAMSEERR